METPKFEIIVSEQTKELQVSTGQELITAYKDWFDQAYDLIQAAEKVKVDSSDQLEEMAKSRGLRLALVKVRTGVDKLRKQLKDESLKKSRAIDGIANVLKFMVEPIETRLLEQEQFAERRQQERKDALRKDRESQLAPYGVDTSVYVLEAMAEDDFEQLLMNTIARHDAKIAAEKKAEEERLRKIEEERQEQERIRAENERLKLENERIAREKQEEYDRAQKEKEAIEAKARAEREAAERKAEAARAQLRREQDKAKKEKAEAEAAKAALEAERQRAEAEKRAIEQKVAQERAEAQKARLQLEHEASLERQRQEDEARAAREAQAKAEAELQATRAAEQKRISDELIAAEKAASAPDKEKLTVFVQNIQDVSIPEMSTKLGLRVESAITVRLAEFIDYASKELEKL